MLAAISGKRREQLVQERLRRCICHQLATPIPGEPVMRAAHEVKQAAAGRKIPFLRMGKNGTQDLLWVSALQIRPRPHVARGRSQEMESHPMEQKVIRFV